MRLTDCLLGRPRIKLVSQTDHVSGYNRGNRESLGSFCGAQLQPRGVSCRQAIWKIVRLSLSKGTFARLTSYYAAADKCAPGSGFPIEDR